MIIRLLVTFGNIYAASLPLTVKRVCIFGWKISFSQRVLRKNDAEEMILSLGRWLDAKVVSEVKTIILQFHFHNKMLFKYKKIRLLFDHLYWE